MLFLFKHFFDKISWPKGLLQSKSTVVKLLLLLLLSGCIQTNSTTDNLAFFSVNESSEESIQEIPPAILTPGEYMDWYNTNRENLVYYSDTMNLKYSVEYRPSEIEALNLVYDKDVKLLDSVLNVKNNYTYFIFSISPNSSDQHFKERAISNYAIFDIQKDFRLVTGKDSIPCSSFIPLREDLVIKNRLSYYLVFEKSPSKGSLYKNTLLYNDRLFNGGTRKFAFANDKIASLPILQKSKKNK